MNDSLVVIVLAAAVAYGTPLLFAALGELLAERSGVLNLGVEGMMLLGAVTGSVPSSTSAARPASRCRSRSRVAALAGAAAALILAFLVITLRANQIVSGLALTIFAGAAGSRRNRERLRARRQPRAVLVRGARRRSGSPICLVGPVVFGQTWLVYASWLCVARDRRSTSAGRGRGSRCAPSARHPPRRTRWASPSRATAISTRWRAARWPGIGGACFSLALTPQWVDGLTAGAGWIAIALVIFAFWRPDLCLVGAYIFGAFSALPLILQARGVTITPQLFQALPYVMTIVVLVLVSTGTARRRLGAPAALGVPYVREER